MLGSIRFKIGQRVRPSSVGIAAHIFTKTRQQQMGIIVKVDQYNCPSVLWEGRKRPIGYHPDFIALDRRRKIGK